MHTTYRNAYLLIVAFYLLAATMPFGLRASTSCSTITSNLAYGSRGSQVVALQQFLVGSGYLAGDMVTGYFGTYTQAAVQSFQRAQGIVSSGTPATTGYGAVGPRTRSVMQKVCVGTPATGGTSGESDTAVSATYAEQNLTFKASASTVSPGGSMKLTWTATGARSCTASGSWSGKKSVKGSQTYRNMLSNKTYTLTCTGTAGGTVTKRVSVTVSDASVTLTLGANDTSIASGDDVTLTWSSSGATSCAASGGWSGTKALSGKRIITDLTETTTFKLSCTGAGRTVTKSVIVHVTSDAAPTASLQVTPATLSSSGGSVTVAWTTNNVTSCTASGGWSGTRGIDGEETFTNVTASKTFTLNCTGAGGTVTKSATVTVGSSTATTTTTLTLTANPTTVSSGGNTTLSWSSTGATSCSASGDWSGTKGASGTETITNITASKTFTLACTGTGGTVTKTTNVSLSAVTRPITMLSAGSVSPQEFADGRTAVIMAHFDDEQLWELPFLENATKIVLASMPFTSAHQAVLSNQPAYMKDIYQYPWGVMSDSDFMSLFRDIAWRMNNYTKSSIKSKIQQYVSSPDVDRIVTHNPWGEYGHYQHRLVYQAVKELAQEYKKDVWVSAITSDLAKNPATYGMATDSGTMSYVNGQYTHTVFKSLRQAFLDKDAQLKAAGSPIRTWTWFEGEYDYPTTQQKYIKVVDNGELLDAGAFTSTLKKISSYNGPYYRGHLTGVAATLLSGGVTTGCRGPIPSDGTSYNGYLNVPMSCSSALEPVCQAGTKKVFFGGSTSNLSTNTETTFACLVTDESIATPPSYDKGEVHGYAIVTLSNQTPTSCNGGNGMPAVKPMTCGANNSPQCDTGFRLVETGRMQVSQTDQERYYVCERTDGTYPTTYRRGGVYGTAVVTQAANGTVTSCGSSGDVQSPVICSSNNMLCEPGFRRIRLGVLSNTSTESHKVMSCERME